MLNPQPVNLPPPGASRQHGIGMIEILVAVIILAIGFLAAGRMQAQGLRASQEAYVRSQAHFLMKDMADRIRINRDGAIAGFYDNANTSNTAYSAAACVTATPSPLPCTPAMIAQNDLAEWSSYFNPPSDATPALLPSGDSVTATGTIERDGDGIYTITASWSQIINGAETTQTMSTEFLP